MVPKLLATHREWLGCAGGYVRPPMQRCHIHLNHPVSVKEGCYLVTGMMRCRGMLASSLAFLKLAPPTPVYIKVARRVELDMCVCVYVCV